MRIVVQRSAAFASHMFVLRLYVDELAWSSRENEIEPDDWFHRLDVFIHNVVNNPFRECNDASKCENTYALM